MKDETKRWMDYAEENLKVASLALGNGLLNACLQNAQQAVEKGLKALIIERGLEFRRVHRIRELAALVAAELPAEFISEEEGDLMDAIYIPSKYPALSVMPDTMPDGGTCERALGIARKALEKIRERLSS